MLWSQYISTGKFKGIDLLNRFATAFPSTTADGKKITDNDVLEHSNGWAGYSSIP